MGAKFASVQAAGLCHKHDFFVKRLQLSWSCSEITHRMLAKAWGLDRNLEEKNCSQELWRKQQFASRVVCKVFLFSVWERCWRPKPQAWTPVQKGLQYPCGKAWATVAGLQQQTQIQLHVRASPTSQLPVRTVEKWVKCSLWCKILFRC